MPVPDIDSGLTFQGYNPRILTGRLPRQESPFYFGGSQVPASLGKVEVSGGAIRPVDPALFQGKRMITSKIYKLPSVRRKV